MRKLLSPPALRWHRRENAIGYLAAYFFLIGADLRSRLGPIYGGALISDHQALPGNTPFTKNISASRGTIRLVENTNRPVLTSGPPPCNSRFDLHIIEHHMESRKEREIPHMASYEIAPQFHGR